MGSDHHDATDRMNRLAILATRAFTESGLRGIDAEVVVAVDVAATMAPMFLNGSIQSLFETLLALAQRFDDDGVVPVWAFGEAARFVGDLRYEESDGWVARHIATGPQDLQAATHYAPLVEALGRRYFPIEWATPPFERKVGGALKRTVREYPSLIDQRPYPIFVIVLTGGDCADPTETLRHLQRASHLPIFFQFAGISPPGIPAPEFAFLKRIDRLPDRWEDNCGFFEPRDYTDPSELFHGLLNGFPAYLQTPRAQAMILPPPEAAPSAGQVPAVLTQAGLRVDDIDDHDDADEVSPEEEARLERERLERQRRREQRARESELQDDPARAGNDLPPAPHASEQQSASPPPAPVPPPLPPSRVPAAPAPTAPADAAASTAAPAPRRAVDAADTAPPRRVSPPTRPYQRTPTASGLPASDAPPARPGARAAPQRPQEAPSPPTGARVARPEPPPAARPSAQASGPLAAPPPARPGVAPARPRTLPPASLATPHAAASRPAPPRTAAEPPTASLASPPPGPPALTPRPERGSAPVAPAGPPPAPPDDEDDPAVRLARIRARRAARQAARLGGPDDDPTVA